MDNASSGASLNLSSSPAVALPGQRIDASSSGESGLSPGWLCEDDLNAQKLHEVFPKPIICNTKGQNKKAT